MEKINTDFNLIKRYFEMLGGTKKDALKFFVYHESVDWIFCNEGYEPAACYWLDCDRTGYYSELLKLKKISEGAVEEMKKRHEHIIAEMQKIEERFVDDDEFKSAISKALKL